MSETKENFIRSDEIAQVTREIIEQMNPAAVYLYNQRINSKNSTTSFKLCVVADVEDKSVAERNIYREIDSDIPFDILIYTGEEWEKLTAIPTTFANKIMTTGTVLHNGQA